MDVATLDTINWENFAVNLFSCIVMFNKEKLIYNMTIINYHVQNANSKL